MDRLGRKTSFPLQFKSSCRGNSVQIKDKNKIDPFAHLTPVARRFIEDSNIVTNSKAYSQNPNSRVNSTRINNKRRSKKPTPSDVFSAEKSSSPQNSARRPAINNYTKFTTTMVGSFRNKSGYSAPDAKRNSGYDTAKGPFFDSRGLNGSTKGEKRSSPYSLKRKPQLPNVSKQRVVIRSNNERYHYSQNSAYPNSIVNPNSSIRAGNNSAKRGTKIENNSFQIVNSFMQTNYNGFGIGNFNQTQAQARKTTYGSLAYPSKNIQKPLNIVNFNKKSNLYNMKNLGYNPNISVATSTKESLRIHKSNKAGSSERRRASDSGQKERFNCVGQLFGKQFGNHDKKPSVSTHQKIRR
mmetsp:Transcript_23972/g.23893  ORF Transcript_23972/g.23893 Transcript_23972/m.23893 type:complete len:353 (-) Transcript_23972:18-1076(-)